MSRTLNSATEPAGELKQNEKLIIQDNSLIGISNPLSGLDFKTLGIIIGDDLNDAINLSGGNTRLIKCLIRCESGGNPNAYNPNDHGSPSSGILQFKHKTFQTYCVNKYRLPNEIMNPTIQVLCAQQILEEPNGWKHWFNCSKQCL